VQFASLTGAMIRTYVATGEPMDKAGGYGIQGGAASFVSKINGMSFAASHISIELMMYMDWIAIVHRLLF
jgi:predicted house-cleaning NTP pyrophosphatase (Maf/HAM1 superfamily)